MRLRRRSLTARSHPDFSVCRRRPAMMAHGTMKSGGMLRLGPEMEVTVSRGTEHMSKTVLWIGRAGWSRRGRLCR